MSEDWVQTNHDPAHTARERRKAKELRSSAWWLRQKERGICHYCGQKVAPEELTMDHIVPVCRGGTSTKGNIVASCPACNKDKKYYTPADILLQEITLDETDSDYFEAPADELDIDPALLLGEGMTLADLEAPSSIKNEASDADGNDKC